MRISYAVENLRCIKEMELCELKPITVLVGRNNSGKSSYLRTIPLLKRSIEAGSRLHSPIQWKDESDVADFNNFVSSVRNYNEEEEITFCFKIRDLSVIDDVLTLDSVFTGRESYVKKISCLILKISVGQHENITVIRRITAIIPENDIEVSFERHGNEKIFKKFKINNFDFKDQSFDAAIVPENNEFFSKYNLRHTNEIEHDMDKEYDFQENPCYTNVYNLLAQKSKNAGASDTSIHATTLNIMHHSRITKKIISDMQKSKDSDLNGLYKNLLEEKNNEAINRLDAVCNIYWSVYSLNAALDVLNYVFSTSSYLNSNRIGGKRLYPHQELGMADISPDGKNLAEYLSFLDSPPESDEGNDFSSMVEKILGFKVSVENKADGYSILIDRKNLKTNIADTGQGISQILPILAQIWKSSWVSELGQTWDLDTIPGYEEFIRLFSIEQPESNLHPKFQAKIADAIFWALKEKHSTIKPIYVIETHSKAFISRLGELIEFEGLSRSDVQIVYFSDEQQSENASKVSTSFFNDEGVLENWPIGFFEF